MIRAKEGYIMTNLVKEVMETIIGNNLETKQSIKNKAAGLFQDGWNIPRHLRLDDIEKIVIKRVINEESGNKLAAADRLGIGRTTLWRKLKN